MRYHFVTMIVTFFLLASCISPVIHPKRDLVVVEKKPAESNMKEVGPPPEKSSSTGKKDFILRYKKKHYHFWINYFAKRRPKLFRRHLKNADQYRKIVQDIFIKHDLPKDLFYVGLIESGFNTYIRSKASAVGPWQFIRGTGKRYGLRIDHQMDERHSIYKSTEAAARYFKDLYNIFGSWELALCAYNAGEYRIINAIRKGNTRSYKELVKKRLIPKETILYIPKVVAARYLAKKIKRQEDASMRIFYRNVAFVEIKGRVNLAKMSRRLGISLKALKKLNPDLKSSWIRPTRRKSFRFYFPSKWKGSVLAYLEGLSFKKVSRRVVRHKKVRSKSRYYRVRRGDNLISVAGKLGVSLKNLKRRNGLYSNKILVGQKLYIPTSKHFVYIVKRGDNLTGIARRFGVRLSALLRFNRLKSKVIYPRQKIRIPPSDQV